MRLLFFLFDYSHYAKYQYAPLSEYFIARGDQSHVSTHVYTYAAPATPYSAIANAAANSKCSLAGSAAFRRGLCSR